jgi:hypothetical protein
MLRPWSDSTEARMSEPEVPFYVIGALVTLYIVAASWRSRDAAHHPAEEREPATPRAQTFDRRMIHWWRALRRRTP